MARTPFYVRQYYDHDRRRRDRYLAGPVGKPEADALAEEWRTRIALSHHGVAAIRTPVAERFALHKLVVSELRVGRTEKSLKDRRQAAVLMSALAEQFPGAIGEAWQAMPRAARGIALKALEKTVALLPAHPRALEEAKALKRG